MAGMMVSLSAIVVLVSIYSEFPIDVQIVAAQCSAENGSCNNTDAIALAYQLGRLDFVSLILAVTAIFLGVFSVYTYFHVERKAKDIAKEAVDAFLETEGRALVERRVNEMLPGEVEKVIKDRVQSHRELDQTEVIGDEDYWGDHLEDHN